LLVSNLSSTSSKAPVPMRAPLEKGCSVAPMVNSTSPNRSVKPTAATHANTKTTHKTAGMSSWHIPWRIEW
jgi:hypothetical protein